MWKVSAVTTVKSMPMVRSEAARAGQKEYDAGVVNRQRLPTVG